MARYVIMPGDWQCPRAEATRKPIAPSNQQRALMLQEPLLAPQSAAIARKRAIGPDYPVTGHDDGNGIAAIGKTHCPHGILVAQPNGQLAIGDCRAAGNPLEFIPHLALEFRAAAIGGDILNGFEITSKIRADTVRKAIGIIRW